MFHKIFTQRDESHNEEFLSNKEEKKYLIDRGFTAKI
jgi:hypothetical protein